MRTYAPGNNVSTPGLAEQTADASELAEQTADASELAEQTADASGASLGLRRLARDGMRMLASTIVTQGLALLAGILVRRSLGPTSMGTWTLVTTIIGYAGLSHLGVLIAAEREYPLALAKGDLARAAGIRRAMGLVNLVGGVVALILCEGWVVATFRMSANLIPACLYVAGAVVIQQAVTFSTVLLRARKRFGVLSFNTLASGLLNALLSILGAALGGLSGLFAGAIAASVVGLAHLLQNRDSDSRPAGKGLVPFLFVAGFPMFVYTMSFLALRTVDRIAIGSRLGMAALGDYSIAILLSTYLFLLPNTVAPVLYPRLQELGVDAGDATPFRTLLRHGLPILGWVLTVLAAVAIIVVPPILRLILPAFRGGLAPAEVLLVGTIPLSLLNLPGQILFTVHRQLIVSLLMVLLTLAAVPAELFAADRFGLMGVAYVTAIIYGVLFVAVVGLCVVALRCTSHAVPIIVESLMPAVALMIALSMMMHGIGATIHPLTMPSELVGYVVVLVALAPCYRRFPGHLRAIRQLSWRS